MPSSPRGTETSLEKAVQMIKGGSSFRIRKELMYPFQVWQAGYHDRWIRDVHEFRMRKQYIELNPVRARSVEKAADFPLGSACGKFRMDPCGFEEGASGAKARGAGGL